MSKGREELSDQPYWEEFYLGREGINILPNPRKYRADWQFDSIFENILCDDISQKVLEVGAGGSIWLPYFARRYNSEVYGIDYSEHGCTMALRNLDSAGVKGEVICSDFNNAPKEWRGNFDLVVSFGLVEHFENPTKVLRVLSGFLKSGGTIVTFVPNTAGKIFYVQKWIDKIVYETHKIFGLIELSEYHRDAGLRVTDQRYLQFLDLSILNYCGVLRGPVARFISRTITAINYPIFKLEQVSTQPIQSPQWCSSMVVVAKTNNGAS